MLIYVVEGSTGEYSDHREWLVKAYREKAAAEAKVLKCDERGRLLSIEQDKDTWYELTVDERNALEAPFKDEDPGLQVDYTGTTYYIHEVELEEGTSSPRAAPSPTPTPNTRKER